MATTATSAAGVTDFWLTSSCTLPSRGCDPKFADIIMRRARCSGGVRSLRRERSVWVKWPLPATLGPGPPAPPEQLHAPTESDERTDDAGQTHGVVQAIHLSAVAPPIPNAPCLEKALFS